jgi:hypothetical protein
VPSVKPESAKLVPAVGLDVTFVYGPPLTVAR